MAKEKKLFRCYRVKRVLWDGHLDEPQITKTYIGDTYARSEAEAIRNIKYRTGFRNEQGYLPGDGGWFVNIEAEEEINETH